MQYTGLKDKNGKEIYEGDVVKADIDGATYITYWEEKEIGFRFRQSNDLNEPYLTVGLPIDDIEIIGNIYENPELLTL